MTKEELFTSVLALGFSSDTEMDSTFMISANRAQRMIFSELSDELIPIGKDDYAYKVAEYDHLATVSTLFGHQ